VALVNLHDPTCNIYKRFLKSILQDHIRELETQLKSRTDKRHAPTNMENPQSLNEVVSLIYIYI
jgi:hypothetical protein